MSQDIEFPRGCRPPDREQIKRRTASGSFRRHTTLVPGHLKNLIDWLSRPFSRKSGSAFEKAIAISGASNVSAAPSPVRICCHALLDMLNADVKNFPRSVPNAQDQPTWKTACCI